MTTYEILDHIEKTDNTEQLHDICGECTEVWDNELMDWVNRPEDYDKWLPNRKTHQ